MKRPDGIVSLSVVNTTMYVKIDRMHDSTEPEDVARMHMIVDHLACLAIAFAPIKDIDIVYLAEGVIDLINVKDLFLS